MKKCVCCLEKKANDDGKTVFKKFICNDCIEKMGRIKQLIWDKAGVR